VRLDHLLSRHSGVRSQLTVDSDVAANWRPRPLPRCPCPQPIGCISGISSHGREGAVAQLGERLLCKQEVIGSIPFSSTNQESEVRNRERPLLAIGCTDQFSALVVRGEWRALKAVMFFNNQEGKAYVDLDREFTCVGLRVVSPASGTQKAGGGYKRKHIL